jgi:uncharacterized membrane protein
MGIVIMININTKIKHFFGGKNKMKKKLVGLLTIFLIGILSISSLVSAAITIDGVELDDSSLGDGTNVIMGVERGEEFKIKVSATSSTDLSDVQVEAYIRGYDHDDRIEDITDVFDMKQGVTYVKKLTLEFPERMDQDRYQLRIRVEGRDGAIAYNDYDLEVDTLRHSISVKDVIFSPEGSVKAGRALLTSVRLRNYGEKDEEGIKVKVSIPDLEISAADYIDELESDESTTSEEIYLRIPSCTDEGTYDAKIEVTFDDGDERIVKNEQVKVVSDETCVNNQKSDSAMKPTIVYSSDAQDVSTSGTIYPITISNPTNNAKTVTFSIKGVEVFGSSKVSPSNVVLLDAKETKTIYVYISANKNTKSGIYSFTTTVSGLGESSQEIMLSANVVESSNGFTSVKKLLEVGLVILVVILVILGLIIGFNKLKNDDDEDTDDESKTYY